VPAWLGATLPAAAARALAAVFVLLLMGGLGTAAIPTVLMRARRAHRTRQFGSPEVLS
jgi:hypothetical protein